MIKILSVGSYNYKDRGTKDVTETIAENLAKNGIYLKLTSYYKNKFLRIFNIIWDILNFRGRKIHIEVFSGPAFNIAIIASMIASLKKKEIILTLHGGKLVEFGKDRKNQIAALFKKSNHIQTPSLFLKNYFTRQGFNVHYLPNSINLEKFPFRRDEIIKNSILWVRAFTNIYNPDLAVKILCEVRKTNPSAKMTMIGPDKGTLNETIKLIKNLGLEDSIKIIGPVKNELLFKYYQTHEVYINTTSYESFGVAIVEAASCGIPIVSTSVGEIPYLWQHEENMLLVNSFNEIDFAQEVDKLFHNKELSSKLSKNARQKAESFDWKRIEPQWIELLKA